MLSISFDIKKVSLDDLKKFYEIYPTPELKNVIENYFKVSKEKL